MKLHLKSLLSNPIQESDNASIQNAKKLYVTCNDVDKIERTGKREVLKLLRYNPVIGIEKWTEYIPRWEWQKFDEQSYHYGMSGPYFLSFDLIPDPRNSNKTIITVSLSRKLTYK